MVLGPLVRSLISRNLHAKTVPSRKVLRENNVKLDNYEASRKNCLLDVVSHSTWIICAWKTKIRNSFESINKNG